MKEKLKFECQLCISGLQIGKLSWTFITVSSNAKFKSFSKNNYLFLFSNFCWFLKINGETQKESKMGFKEIFLFFNMILQNT